MMKMCYKINTILLKKVKKVDVEARKDLNCKRLNIGTYAKNCVL